MQHSAMFTAITLHGVTPAMDVKEPKGLTNYMISSLLS